jgi:transposase InsO family protein
VETLRQWIKAFEERGDAGLEQPRSTGRRRGRPPMAKAVADEIVSTQRSFPHFGLKRVRDYLARFVGLRVSAGGVRAVLAREGVERTADPPRRGRRRRRPAVRRFERAKPGQLWQSDFTSYVLGRSGRPAHLIVFMDDYSRYVVAWHVDLSATAAIAKNTLRAGIEKYGKPEEVLTDQGPQYYAWRGRSAFRKLLDTEGIKHVVARSHHPQTLGKCERLWESIGRELWDRTHPRDLEEARERLAHFIQHYNHFRPHQGIGGMVPADRFFSAEPAVRKAIESAISKNALRLALGERPRRPVYLVGQVDGESVSLHGERGRLVVSTKDGIRNMALDELGMHKEVDGGARDDGSTGNGSDGGPAGSARDAAASSSHGGVEVGAAGVSDQGDLGRGERGGEGEGARADDGGPGILARPAEQDGAGAATRSAADPCLADESAGGGGHGGGDAQAAEREARTDAEARSGGQGTEAEDRAARARERGAAPADPAPAHDAGQREARAPQGRGPEGRGPEGEARCDEALSRAEEGAGAESSAAESGRCSSRSVDEATSGSSPGRST